MILPSLKKSVPFLGLVNSATQDWVLGFRGLGFQGLGLEALQNQGSGGLLEQAESFG